MRQIKFRRPMYKKGKFDRFEYWGFGLENHLFDGPPFDSLDNPLKTAHESVEQFTGLRDKDGVEIYEGDILSDTMTGLRTGVVKYAGLGFVCLCDWETTESLKDMFWIGTDRLKVIGNRWENGGLLK